MVLRSQEPSYLACVTPFPKSLQPVPPSLESIRFLNLPGFYDALLSTLAHPHKDTYAYRLRQQLYEYVGYLNTEYVRCFYREVKDLPMRIHEAGVA